MNERDLAGRSAKRLSGAAKKAPAPMAAYTARITRGDFNVAIRFVRPAGQFTLQAERLLSAKVFEVCATLERAAAELAKAWPVSPSAMDGIIRIECEDHEVVETIQIAAQALAACSVTEVR